MDTSVWVNHFREHNPALVQLLEMDAVVVHPMVLGELACGTPPERTRTLSDLSVLQLTRQAQWQEVMGLIEREKLFGLGCGWVDVSLLASALLSPGLELWTMDKRLSALADRFGVMHRAQLN